MPVAILPPQVRALIGREPVSSQLALELSVLEARATSSVNEEDTNDEDRDEDKSDDGADD